MTSSDSIDLLAAALPKVQADMEPAEKDATNPHFRAKYATLAAAWDVWRKVGPKHGFSIIQGASAEGMTVKVTTRLLHSSGQWIEDTVTMSAKDAGPQAIGSCISYGRRYGLSALVGVTAEDDDGEAATERTGTRPAFVKVDAPTVSDRTAAPAGEPYGEHGELYVKRVDSKPTRKAGTTRHEIMLSTGEVVATIKDKLAGLARQACEDASPVAVETKQTPYGTDLVSLHIEGRTLEPEGFPDDDSIPF